MMTDMAELTRRSLLRIGAGAAATAAGAYALGMNLSRSEETARAISMTSVGAPLDSPLAPPGAAPTYVTGSFVSQARGGVSTNWVIARPPGQTGPLRTVIALHGQDSDAAMVMEGIDQSLAKAVEAGLPPFAVAAADGGGMCYWHKRASGEDSGAMVVDEFIPMLASQGLDTSRIGFWGWSMGGYGALLLGARLGPARTTAICAVSPALWNSPDDATPGAFDGPEDYAANSVWGLPALASIPIRIDCGDDDPFISATKPFIAQLPHGAAGGFSPGGHNAEFWGSQQDAEAAWLAPLVVA